MWRVLMTVGVLLPMGARAQSTPSDDTDLFKDDDKDDAVHVKYGDSDEERAKELVRNGEVLSDQGHYASAVLSWEDAYALSHDPLLLLRIAGAYEKMGSLELLVHTLEAYREVAPEAEWEGLDAKIGTLEGVLADQPVDAAGPAPEPRASAEEIAGVVAMDVPDKVFDDVIEKVHKVRPLPITLVGSGLVALGVGAGFGSRSDAAHTDALGQCVTLGGDLLCQPGVAPFLQQEKRAGLAADVTFGVGGAAILAGIVTAIFHPRATITPVVTPEGTVGVAVETP